MGSRCIHWWNVESPPSQHGICVYCGSEYDFAQPKAGGWSMSEGNRAAFTNSRPISNTTLAEER